MRRELNKDLPVTIKGGQEDKEYNMDLGKANEAKTTKRVQTGYTSKSFVGSTERLVKKSSGNMVWT